MRPTAALRALGPIDLHSIARDPMLRWFALLPLGVVALIRVAMPPLLEVVSEWLSVDVTVHYAAITGYAVLMLIPNITGIVIGFLLLDQRDDRTLTALLVTPLSLEGYLIYRLTVPMLISLVMSVALVPLAGVTGAGALPLLMAALTATPMAAVLALFLAAFGRDKVRGFALMKATGVVLWPPILAYFVEGPWQFAFGVVPPYWPAKVFWVALDGGGHYGVYVLAGLAYQGLLIYLLLGRYRRDIARP